MKILNIIALLGLTTLPIVGCSKKINESVEQKNEDNNKKDKTYYFEIKNLQKVIFHFSPMKNYLTQVNIKKKITKMLVER